MEILRILIFCASLTSAACTGDEPEPMAREVPGGWIVLQIDEARDGHLFFKNKDGSKTPIACERLEGAWGLWLTDIDGDSRAEIIVTLKKKARFDPVLENRLHVYSIENSRCVPAWRGTRLSGRFDDIYASYEKGDRLWAFERVGSDHRIAQYRWKNFGYLLEKTLWQGSENPPIELQKMFDSFQNKEKKGQKQ